MISASRQLVVENPLPVAKPGFWAWSPKPSNDARVSVQRTRECRSSAREARGISGAPHSPMKRVRRSLPLAYLSYTNEVLLLFAVSSYGSTTLCHEVVVPCCDLLCYNMLLLLLLYFHQIFTHNGCLVSLYAITNNYPVNYFSHLLLHCS